MHNDIEKILISKEELDKRVKELARDINDEYQNNPVVCVSVLKGGAFFTVDLLKNLEMPLSIDFICVSSYGSSTISSGELIVKKDLDTDVSGKDVLIIEDIIDTGVTLSKLKTMLLSRGAKSVKIVTILDKKARRVVKITADYSGFSIPDEFVVGYGLDYDEKYRNLPYVGILKRSVYEK